MANPVLPSTESCGLEHLAPVPRHHLLLNPEVPDPPADIPDCNDDFPSPLTPVPPCPAITIDGSDKKIRPVEFTCDDAKFTFSVVMGPCCDFDFDFEIDVPCPILKMDGDTVECDTAGVIEGTVPNGKSIWLPPGETPFFRFTATKGADCSFDFDFEIDFPCPLLELGDVSVDTRPARLPGEGSFTFTIIPLEDCTFDFDIIVEFPCVTLELGTTTTTFGTATSPSFEMTLVPDPESCSYSFDFDITFPCPTLEVGTATITIDEPETEPAIEFDITPSAGCTFTFDLSIVVPKSCPILEVGTVIISMDEPDVEPAVEFMITPSERCTFTFDLSIVVPKSCPILHVGTTTITVTEPETEPTLDFTIVPLPGCIFTFDLAITVPTGYACPTFETLSSGTYVLEDVSDHVTFTIEKDIETCSFTATLDIDFPCPNIHVDDVTWDIDFTGVGNVELTITPSLITCAFAVDLFVEFPCVAIDTSSEAIQLEDDDPAQDGSCDLIATPDAETCAYNLHLEVQFPCPHLRPTPGLVTLHQGIAGGEGSFIIVAQAATHCEWLLGADITWPCPTITVEQADIHNDIPGAELALDFRIVASEIDCSFAAYLEISVPCVELEFGSTLDTLCGASISLALTPDTDTAFCKWTIDVEVTDPPEEVTFTFLKGPMTVTCNLDGTFTVEADEGTFTGWGTVT